MNKMIQDFIFKPPPPVGAGGGYMFSGRPSVRASVFHVVVLFPRYLQYLLTDFRQTFVTGASWGTDDLITFLGQKVKGQGHTIAVEAHSTRRYSRVQLFLVLVRSAVRHRPTCCSVCESYAVCMHVGLLLLVSW